MAYVRTQEGGGVKRLRGGSGYIIASDSVKIVVDYFSRL